MKWWEEKKKGIVPTQKLIWLGVFRWITNFSVLLLMINVLSAGKIDCKEVKEFRPVAPGWPIMADIGMVLIIVGSQHGPNVSVQTSQPSKKLSEWCCHCTSKHFITEDLLKLPCFPLHVKALRRHFACHSLDNGNFSSGWRVQHWKNILSSNVENSEAPA